MDDQHSPPRAPAPGPPPQHHGFEGEAEVPRELPPPPPRPVLPPPEPPAPQTPPHHAAPTGPPPVPPASRVRRALPLLLVLLAVGGLVAWLVLRTGNQPAPTGRFQSTGPMPVGTARVERGDIPIVLNALGTVTPLATVTVKTQINGQLIEIAFKEGEIVKKGDFLAQIDPRPYQVALAQAEAQLARDQAALRNSEIDLARYRTLLGQNSIARQTVDTQAALVEQNRGVVRADQAQVDAQKLNLAYARIVAPIGGRVGLRQVDAGNYVQTSDPNGIVVITQIQPISVIFTLPEDSLRPVLRRLREGAALPVTAYDRTGTTRLDDGTLQTIDNQIDTATGTVKLRAVFDNAEQVLFPNQFVNVRLLVDTLRDKSIVPVAAVQRGAPGSFVYLVNPGGTVAAQPVTLGPSEGQRVAVLDGVQPGQLVVTDGADRLKDGAQVRIPGAAPARAGAPNGTAEPGSAAPAQAGEGRPGQGRRRGGE